MKTRRVCFLFFIDILLYSLIVTNVGIHIIGHSSGRTNIHNPHRPLTLEHRWASILGHASIGAIGIKENKFRTPNCCKTAGIAPIKPRQLWILLEYKKERVSVLFTMIVIIITPPPLPPTAQRYLNIYTPTFSPPESIELWGCIYTYIEPLYW